jgi:hypothetical protein
MLARRASVAPAAVHAIREFAAEQKTAVYRGTGNGIKSRRSRRTNGFIQPPPMDGTHEVRMHRLRFNCSTNVTPTSITSNELLAACGIAASSTTAGNTLASTVKIHSIEIYAEPTGTNGSAVETILVWASPGAGVAKDEFVVNTVLGSSGAGYFKSTPPKGTLTGDWLGSGTMTIFQIAAPIGSIVDVVVSYRINNALTGATYVSTGLAAGDVYYAPLDGHNGLMKPLGVANIAQ